MKPINELSRILRGHFDWNKARLDCFSGMLLALLVAKSVNLAKLSMVFLGEAKPDSTYKRLQRFFRSFEVNYRSVACFVVQFFGLTGKPVYLSVDRTNWKFGKANINIFMLGLVHQGIALPLIWSLLDKRGNSNANERIALMDVYQKWFGKEGILGLLGDREFIGDVWFEYLLEHGIPFYIRVRHNTISTNARGQEVKLSGLFHDLKPNEQTVLSGKRKVGKHKLHIAALRLLDGELLIVVTDRCPKDAIKIYGLRWEIETLFGCLKTRGFCFEDTHITNQARLKKMVAVLAIAFCWAHKTGEWRNDWEPIKVKNHGRKLKSIFRHGLDYLTEAISKYQFMKEKIQDCFKILRKTTQIQIQMLKT